MEKGDVVRHKSGGPSMVVTGVNDDQTVICRWFNKSEKLESSAFEESELELDA